MRNKALFSIIRIAFAVLIILAIIYFAISLASVGYDFGYRVFTETAVDEEPGKDVLVQISEGMSESDVAKSLEEKGLIRDSRLFLLQFKLSVYKGKLVPDVYTLNTSMTPKQMMAVITASEQETESTEGTEAVYEDPDEESTEDVTYDGIDAGDEETRTEDGVSDASDEEAD